MLSNFFLYLQSNYIEVLLLLIIIEIIRLVVIKLQNPFFVQRASTKLASLIKFLEQIKGKYLKYKLIIENIEYIQYLKDSYNSKKVVLSRSVQLLLDYFYKRTVESFKVVRVVKLCLIILIVYIYYLLCYCYIIFTNLSFFSSKGINLLLLIMSIIYIVYVIY